MLYAAGKPIFVIDTYTRRLVDRMGVPVSGNRYEDYQALFMDNLPRDAKLYNEYHALIDRHGSRTCKKTPLCESCCLLTLCPTGRRATGQAPEA